MSDGMGVRVRSLDIHHDEGAEMSHEFGTMPTGEPVTAHTLSTDHGLQLTVLDLGATVQSLGLRDGDGRLVELTLGFDDAAGYLSSENPYFGATVGRYANRISGATFRLDDAEHVLTANEGPTCLHGGVEGFHARLWSVVEVAPQQLTLRLVSPDGDQGFPGELTATVTYRVDGRSVVIDYTATTTAPTVVGLTNHTYFNLGGAGGFPVDDHLLSVNASGYLPVDDASIPHGRVDPVVGTPFDLTTAAMLGPRVRAAHEQTSTVRGIDHAFVLDGSGLRPVARLEHPASGRALDISTDRPSLQVYTGNMLDGSLVGRGQRFLRQGDGIALETQGYPDAPNRPEFPSPVLRPGETYRARTRWTVTAGRVTG
jgi:aldose 1-epimerase